MLMFSSIQFFLLAHMSRTLPFQCCKKQSRFTTFTRMAHKGGVEYLLEQFGVTHNQLPPVNKDHSHLSLC